MSARFEFSAQPPPVERHHSAREFTAPTGYSSSAQLPAVCGIFCCWFVADLSIRVTFAALRFSQWRTFVWRWLILRQFASSSSPRGGHYVGSGYFTAPVLPCRQIMVLVPINWRRASKRENGKDAPLTGIYPGDGTSCN